MKENYKKMLNEFDNSVDEFMRTTIYPMWENEDFTTVDAQSLEKEIDTYRHMKEYSNSFEKCLGFEKAEELLTWILKADNPAKFVGRILNDKIHEIDALWAFDSEEGVNVLWDNYCERSEYEAKIANFTKLCDVYIKTVIEPIHQAIMKLDSMAIDYDELAPKLPFEGISVSRFADFAMSLDESLGFKKAALVLDMIMKKENPVEFVGNTTAQYILKTNKARVTHSECAEYIWNTYLVKDHQ